MVTLYTVYRTYRLCVTYSIILYFIMYLDIMYMRAYILYRRAEQQRRWRFCIHHIICQARATLGNFTCHARPSRAPKPPRRSFASLCVCARGVRERVFHGLRIAARSDWPNVFF